MLAQSHRWPCTPHRNGHIVPGRQALKDRGLLDASQSAEGFADGPPIRRAQNARHLADYGLPGSLRAVGEDTANGLVVGRLNACGNWADRVRFVVVYGHRTHLQRRCRQQGLRMRAPGSRCCNRSCRPQFALPRLHCDFALAYATSKAVPERTASSKVATPVGPVQDKKVLTSWPTAV